MANIIKPGEFKPEYIKLGGTRDMGNGTGGKTVYINYQGEPLRVQTPKMTMPFGLTPWPKAEDGKDPIPPQKYSLELSFKDIDKNEKIRNFYNMLCDMDYRMLEEGMKNSTQWFKKEHKSLDVTDAVYKRMLKIRAKNDYPPIFKVNVPYKDGKITCDTYDENRQKINPLDHNLRGAQVMAIIQCTGIWLAGGNFGCSWKVLQMCVTPSKGAIEGFAFDLEDEEENDESSSPVAADAGNENMGGTGNGHRGGGDTSTSNDNNKDKLDDKELFRDDEELPAP